MDSCCVRVLVSDHLCVFVKYIYSCTALFCLVDPGVVTLVGYFTHMNGYSLVLSYFTSNTDMNRYHLVWLFLFVSF